MKQSLLLLCATLLFLEILPVKVIRDVHAAPRPTAPSASRKKRMEALRKRREALRKKNAEKSVPAKVGKPTHAPTLPATSVVSEPKVTEVQLAQSPAPVEPKAVVPASAPSKPEVSLDVTQMSQEVLEDEFDLKPGEIEARAELIVELNESDAAIEAALAEAKEVAGKVEQLYAEIDDQVDDMLPQIQQDKMRYANFYHEMKHYLAESEGEPGLPVEVKKKIVTLNFGVKEFFAKLSQIADLESKLEQELEDMVEAAITQRSEEFFNIVRTQGEADSIKNEAYDLSNNISPEQALETLKNFKTSAQTSLQKLKEVIMPKTEQVAEKVRQSLGKLQQSLTNLDDNRSKIAKDVELVAQLKEEAAAEEERKLVQKYEAAAASVVQQTPAAEPQDILSKPTGEKFTIFFTILWDFIKNAFLGVKDLIMRLATTGKQQAPIASKPLALASEVKKADMVASPAAEKKPLAPVSAKANKADKASQPADTLKELKEKGAALANSAVDLGKAGARYVKQVYQEYKTES